MVKNICGKAKSPKQVRDAILQCFYTAHKELVEQSVDLPETEKKVYTKAVIEQILIQKFKDVGGDYNNPTKESLFRVVLSLATMAQQFRSVDVIARHFAEMLNLIVALK